MDNNQEEELKKIDEKQKEEIAQVEQQTKPAQNISITYAVPIAIGLFLLFVILIVWGQKQNVSSPSVMPPPQIAIPAPSPSPTISPPTPESKNTTLDFFALEDQNGNIVGLSSFRGKVVFLNFWATWCPPCRAEMPSIEKLYDEMKGKDFVIMAVSIDKEKETVRNFIEENKYTFPIYFDPDSIAANYYKVSGIPTTLLIDKNGNIISKDVGSKDWSSQKYISKIESVIHDISIKTDAVSYERIKEEPLIAGKKIKNITGNITEESQALAEEIIESVIGYWDWDEFKKYLTPPGKEGFKQVFFEQSQRYGKIMKVGDCVGDVFIGKDTITAIYSSECTFEKQKVLVGLSLSKQNNKWYVSGWEFTAR